MDRVAPTDWFFLDEPERALIAEILPLVSAPSHAPQGLLQSNFTLLRLLAESIVASPSLTRSFAGDPSSPRDGESLIDLLCRTPDYDFDLKIPTRAVVGQAYLVAKINMFKSLRYALDAAGAPGDLRERLLNEIGQSIYSKMAEEILVALLTDPTGRRAVKVRAGRILFGLWENRLLIEVDDFAPLLESAWEARNRVHPRLGTMLGTEELFRLFHEARDDRFLDYFGRDETPGDEITAFEEFLFGLSHEEIAHLRGYMAERRLSVLSTSHAQQVLGGDPLRWAREHQGPQGLYSSYRERKVQAHYRALRGVPGPKKTAEEYMLAAYLAALATVPPPPM